MRIAGVRAKQVHQDAKLNRVPVRLGSRANGGVTPHCARTHAAVSTSAITLVPQASATHFAFMAFAFFMAFFGASAGALAAFIAFGIAEEGKNYTAIVWLRQFRIA